MNRIKIASLDVYINDDDKIPSRLGKVGPKEYELDVCPLVDERLLENLKKHGRIEGSTIDLMQSIIAHELGHFVAHITKCPTHARDSFTDVKTTVNGVESVVGISLPAEVRAWTLAGEMLGDKLNKKLRDVATYGYMFAEQEAA